MIVCHCMNIADHEIRAAVDWMRASDPETIITPGKIYHALGKRADCGGCMPLFLDTMRNCDSFGVPGDDAAVPPMLQRMRARRLK
ncbi:(2Fe-2S)-binding protein [Ruixingdingia sedimenti]|uniref:(2Fe-2S)-binding protein n=1 Tax=Ruixingdingia sedimenti TaxID=3073604 RepID=A0ABU1F6M9_9RHOB|nr:(2Fe-2S)-binding protein [Xinfangfangia sp. LG-4]MDR5652522.1 (2Fe-2S)-binding protein [Xinfangfangia sp. LG-4]